MKEKWNLLVGCSPANASFQRFSIFSIPHGPFRWPKKFHFFSPRRRSFVFSSPLHQFTPWIDCRSRKNKTNSLSFHPSLSFMELLLLSSLSSRSVAAAAAPNPLKERTTQLHSFQWRERRCLQRSMKTNQLINFSLLKRNGVDCFISAWSRIARQLFFLFFHQLILKSWMEKKRKELNGRGRCILHSSSIDLFDFVSSLPPSINHIDHECSMQPYCYNINLIRQLVSLINKPN